MVAFVFDKLAYPPGRVSESLGKHKGPGDESGKRRAAIDMALEKQVAMPHSQNKEVIVSGDGND